MGDEKEGSWSSEKFNIDQSQVPNEYRYLLNQDNPQILLTNEKKVVGVRSMTSQRTSCSKSTRINPTQEQNSSYDIDFSHDATIAQILRQYQTSTVYSRRRLLETNLPLLQDSVRAYHEKKIAYQKEEKPDKIITVVTASTQRR